MSSAVPTTTAPSASPAVTAAIPSWETAQLQALSAQGLLSGVDPAILAAQDQAESSGQGGAINASGYGGFFGLGAGSSYPAGTATTTLLRGTGTQAFSAQAQLAASEDAALLSKTGGNTTAMEQAYQLGANSPAVGTSTATEGTKVFAQDGVPSVDPVGAQTTGIVSSVGGAIGGAIGSAASAAGTAIVSAFGPMLLKVVFVIGALGLIVLGFSRMFPGVTRTVTSAAGPMAAVAAA